MRDQRAIIEYVPTTASAPLSGAQNVTVSVVAVDKRSGPRDLLSLKKGLAQAVVRTGNDVVEVVRGAVERELKAQGFAIGAGGFVLTVDVENFYSDFRTSPSLFMSANADVALTLRVRDPAGATRYRHTYEGVAQINPIYNESAEKVKATLEQALAMAVGQIASDSALQAALVRSPVSYHASRQERTP